MTSAEIELRRLDITLNSSSALREHLDNVRSLAMQMTFELQCAATELQGNLEKIDPVGSDPRTWGIDRSARIRYARIVTRGYKRQAEYAMAIAVLCNKTWTAFSRLYLPLANAEKPAFDIEN